MRSSEGYAASFLSTGFCLAAAAPLGLLAGVGMLGDMPGEWSRSALLAYASVLLGLLSGIVLGSGTLPVAGAAPLALGSLFVAFSALSLGGVPGYALIVMAYGGLLAIAWFRPSTQIPWILPLLAAVACMAALMREAAA